jgi:hypothetical protein
MMFLEEVTRREASRLPQTLQMVMHYVISMKEGWGLYTGLLHEQHDLSMFASFTSFTLKNCTMLQDCRSAMYWIARK